MTDGMKTSEFALAGAGPWAATLANWVQTGNLDWRLLLATAIMNLGYAVSRGMAKSG